MSAAHWAQVKSLRQALYDEAKEYCSQCHEEWIIIQLNRDAVCHRCELKDMDKEPLDSGEMPEHLPALSQVEDSGRTRVHRHLEAERIRGL